MARYLYSELASVVRARLNCDKKRISGGAQTTDASRLADEWCNKHKDSIRQLLDDYMPHGSGFDHGTQLDLDASHGDKLVFTTAFHHMHESGMYDGWTEHTVTVTPSLLHGFHLRISGRNRNGIKEYISDTFHEALKTEIETVRRAEVE